jgi:hypothetical protein
MWINSIERLGWSVVPIYVGLQAPCSARRYLHIDGSSASSEGASAAGDAAARAANFGLPYGSPIYLDMEAYTASLSCSAAVLSFIDSWTRGLHTAGFLSGVYSSAGAGIRDLSRAYGRGIYASPDDVWIARWDGKTTTSDPCCSPDQWKGARLHQFRGGHIERHGGVSINVDSNYDAGAIVVPGPLSTFTTPDGSLLVGPPVGSAQVVGRSIGFFGIRSVRVSYSLGQGVQADVPARLSCARRGRSCAWTAALPTLPGRYTVAAAGTDAVGRVEQLTSWITIFVV